MNPFVQKLRHGARRTPQDEAMLGGLVAETRRIDARGDIQVGGGRARALSVVLDEWACIYKPLEDGRRQITTVLLPGDLCEPFSVLPRIMDRSLGALTPVIFAQVSPKSLRVAAWSNPRIDEAIWWDLLVATAIEREPMVSLGRRTAVESLGHLFCEPQARVKFVTGDEGAGFDVFLTRNDLADLLGLSAVHVNRSRRELRASGLISLYGRRLVIHDLERLRGASLFDPAYLHPVVTAPDRTPGPATRRVLEHWDGS